ncbi:MAG: hypothetical protein KGL39_34585 [Patescibacteria group bacterium]|nr:hypothetical protein [Patescibacteria group bacterium]
MARNRITKFYDPQMNDADYLDEALPVASDMTHVLTNQLNETTAKLCDAEDSIAFLRGHNERLRNNVIHQRNTIAELQDTVERQQQTIKYLKKQCGWIDLGIVAVAGAVCTWAAYFVGKWL